MRSLRLLPCIVSIAPAARWEQISDYLDSGPDRIPPCGSNGNFVGLSLDPVQYEEDKAIIFKLLEVSSPEQLGVLSQKKNSDIITPGYKGINIMNIFRISTADRLEAYEELLKNESTSDSSFVISTAAPNDEATKLWRSQHNRSEREHLLLHGTRWDSVKKIICQGFGPPRKTGAFGRGLYFADQIEKSDQYSPDVADDANWVVVVRANMARTVQVQREIPCTEDPAERKKHQIFHWADPVGGHKDEITWQNREDNSGNFTMDRHTTGVRFKS